MNGERQPGELVASAAAACAGGSARPAGPADAVDGVIPGAVVEPTSSEALGTTLAWALREKLTVVVRGGGTKIDWGAPPRRVDLLLSTRRMQELVAHRHADLTVTVEAGARLAAVNRELARHGQWIPLDPPFGDRATIGGIVAANDSGPRRHRYGAPRDLIIGVTMIRADGRAAKAGGIVVKNVAGYDLGRLLTGSFGSLAVITSATFKLFPIPHGSRTVLAEAADVGRLQALVASLLASQLTPSAIEIDTPPPKLFVRFESTQAAVEQQAEDALRLLAGQGDTARILGGGDEAAAWADHDSRVWRQGDGAILRLGLMPTDLAATLTWIEQTAGAAGFDAIGRAGLGALLVRVGGDAEAQGRLVAALRTRIPLERGSVVVRRGSRELKARVDPWGPVGDGLELMRAVKNRFDPAGILGAGRGPFL